MRKLIYLSALLFLSVNINASFQTIGTWYIFYDFGYYNIEINTKDIKIYQINSKNNSIENFVVPVVKVFQENGFEYLCFGSDSNLVYAFKLKKIENGNLELYLIGNSEANSGFLHLNILDSIIHKDNYTPIRIACFYSQKQYNDFKLRNISDISRKDIIKLTFNLLSKELELHKDIFNSFGTDSIMPSIEWIKRHPFIYTNLVAESMIESGFWPPQSINESRDNFNKYPDISSFFHKFFDD